MITFTTALVLLVLGYVVYGAFVERVFGADASRKTPCYTMADGVDYTPMPTWKVYLIQFLNIAGTGPIFGAILGILYGPAANLWINIEYLCKNMDIFSINIQESETRVICMFL